MARQLEPPRPLQPGVKKALSSGVAKNKTRRRMARERRGAGSSVVSIETLYYKTIY